MSWVRNLYVTAAGLFVIMLSFSSMSPFLPFFVNDLGITDPRLSKIWTGMLISATPLFATLVSPAWGLLADRYGRKPMVLRASFSAAIVMTLTGFVGNVYQMMALRVLQGLFGGYPAAALALVTSKTPKDKIGYTIGVLQTGQILGTVVGPSFGGIVASYLSYRAVFELNGLLIFAVAILILLVVREDFVPPKTKGRSSSVRLSKDIFISVPVLTIVVVTIFLTQFAIRSAF